MVALPQIGDGRNDDLLSIVAEYKQFNVELEEYKKLLADLQARSLDLSNSIKDKDIIFPNQIRALRSYHRSI
ncbi:MAG: hypothetical protein ACI8WT_003172 [Clostridium sp.]|jgi:hypothetical protein